MTLNSIFLRFLGWFDMNYIDEDSGNTIYHEIAYFLCKHPNEFELFHTKIFSLSMMINFLFY
jgi:hypothetical protein